MGKETIKRDDDELSSLMPDFVISEPNAEELLVCVDNLYP